MNRNTRTTIAILAIALSGSFNMLAQNREENARIIKANNVEKLHELSKQFDKEFHEKQAEAFRLAEINNWPLVINKKDGGLSKLVEVTKEGTPIYLTTHNAGSAITSRTNHLYPGGSLGLNLTGLGMVVGLWDGDYPRTTHVDYIGRFTTADGSGPIAFHPSHVLGTMIGAGAANANARGMAYQATGQVNDYSNDVSEMAIQATDGLLLSNHSYGYDASALPEWYFGAYISISKAIDDITFNAPYYQPVFSAGNDGVFEYDILTDRTMSKNGIAVGAVNQVSAYSGPGSVTLADFSSWGPTDDRRVKPDIVTKGVNVRSASNTGNTAYALSDGTSMSTPGITGTLLLLQQHYKNLNGGTFMRSSTLRGLMAHSADEAGSFDGPDPLFGWGLMNAKRAAEIISAKGVESIVDELVLLPGSIVTRQISVPGTQNLTATLAWTDPSGPANNGVNNSRVPVLVNNLDIKITKGTETYYPWKLATENSDPALKDVNDVDNIEKVEVPNASGVYTITISHKGPSLSNPGGAPSQAYSLIVTGINATAGLDELRSEVFNIWPNPAEDMLHISIVQDSASSSYEMYDVQGRLVLRNTMTGMENAINVSGLTAGIYFVKVSSGNESETKKIIIK
jgi:serine protease AprX